MTSPHTTTASPAEREVRPTSIAWRTDLPERPSTESRRRQSSLTSSIGSVSLPTGSGRGDRQRLLSSPPPPPLVSPNSHSSLPSPLHQIPPLLSTPVSLTPTPAILTPHPRLFMLSPSSSVSRPPSLSNYLLSRFSFLRSFPFLSRNIA